MACLLTAQSRPNIQFAVWDFVIVMRVIDRAVFSGYFSTDCWALWGRPVESGNEIPPRRAVSPSLGIGPNASSIHSPMNRRKFSFFSLFRWVADFTITCADTFQCAIRKALCWRNQRITKCQTPEGTRKIGFQFTERVLRLNLWVYPSFELNEWCGPYTLNTKEAKVAN